MGRNPVYGVTATMKTCIDYLSFTVTWGDGGLPEKGWMWEDAKWHIEQFLGDDITDYLAGDGWGVGAGRRPYASSFRNSSKGVAVFWSGKASHALIEVSGKGMLAIRQHALETALLNVCLPRVTRIDIATDIDTDIRPIEFVQQRDKKRSKSDGHYNSRDGQTEYVGSRQSERCARVYRYAPPHPRAHLLRVEHECKGDTAKVVVAGVLSQGVETVQRDLGFRMGWLHPTWEPDQQVKATYALPAKHRENAKTELWLRTQAATSFAKLVKNGTIDNPEAWLREVFLSPLDNMTK